MNNHGLVTITEEEYHTLRENSLFLECLESSGAWMTPEWSKGVTEFVRRIGELDD